MTDELERLLKAGTPGPWRTMAGDPLAVDAHEAVYVCKMTGATPVTRLAANAALIVAAINALPGLLERVKRYESALEKIANPNTQITEVDEKYDEPVTVALDMWHAREIARVALNQETGQ